MSKRRRNGVLVWGILPGSGYLAGDKDVRDAGPIPESAGVKVVAKPSVRKPKTTSGASVKAGRQKKR